MDEINTQEINSNSLNVNQLNFDNTINVNDNNTRDLLNLFNNVIETEYIDNNDVKSIRNTLVNDKVKLNNKSNSQSYFDNPLKVQLFKPDYFDPIVLSDKKMQKYYVRCLSYELAKDLYTYVDFNKVKSNKDYARECIQRARDFVEVYLTYIVKGIDSSFDNIDWEKIEPVVDAPDTSELENVINGNNNQESNQDINTNE